MIAKNSEVQNFMCPMRSKAGDFVACAGNNCMAWTWIHDVPRREFDCLNLSAQNEQDAGPPPSVDGDYVFYPFGPDGSAVWIETEASANRRRMGACGLICNPWARS